MIMTQQMANTALTNAVEVIYAGGASTISTTSEGYITGGRAFDLIGMLDERLPEFEPPYEFGRRQVAFTDLSENIVPSNWDALDEKITVALNRLPRGVMITYGTDTIEQLIRHLHFKFHKQLQEYGQKIVVTGANRDIEDPSTDAWENLMFALNSAAAASPAGIYVAFHGKLIPGLEAAKLPYTPGAEQTFVSIKDPAYKKALEAQKNIITTQLTALRHAIPRQSDESVATIYDVNIVSTDHTNLLTKVALHENTKAVIINLYRCGTANTETPGQSVTDLITYFRTEKNITCFGVTENGEPVDLHAYETSVKLRKAGLVPLYDMYRDVAIEKLYLTDKDTPQELIRYMLTSFAGEIDESRINKDDIEALINLYKK